MKISLILCATCILLHAVVDIECVCGGKIANEGQFPYQVLVGDRQSDTGCNGVILKARYVLTTAICGDSHKTIIVGTILRSRGGTVIDIDEVIKHPEHDDDDDLQYNIAVLRTDKAIQFSPYIQSVRLPAYYQSGVANLIISGWGRTEYGSAEYLHYLKTQTMNPDYCKIQLPDDLNYKFSDAQNCTKNQYKTGLCEGDEGSPLVDHNKYLIGIASFVYDRTRCGKGYPDLYISIYNLKNWIESKSSGHTFHNTNTIPALIFLTIIFIIINLK